MKIRSLVLVFIGFLLALPLLASAVGSDPYGDGVQMFNEGKYEQSLPYLLSAVQSMPKDPVRRLTYGIALVTARQYDDAISQFREVSTILPQDPVPYFLLEGAYLAKGSAADAQLAHGSANTKLAGIQSSGPLTMGSPLGSLSQRLSKHPNNAIAQNLLGDICQMRGRYTNAISYYSLATELAPNWAKAWFNLGIANLHVTPANAVDDFRRVIQLDPNNLQAQLWLGDALVAQNDLKNALQAYENAAKDKSLEATARARIGNLYLKQNDPRGAEREFRKAQAQAPESISTAAGLGDALQQQQRLDESEKEYKKASDLSRSSPSVDSVVSPNLANVYMGQGQYQKAIDELKRSIKLNPTSLESFSMLTDAYSRAGKLKEGIEENENALAADRNDTVAMRFLVFAYAAAGNADNRADMARKLIKRFPDEADVWYRELGCALVAVKDNEGAIEALKAGLSVNPLLDSAGIIKEAQKLDLLANLKTWFESQSAAKKVDSPSLILANIYEFENDFYQAAEVRKKLVERYPDKQHFWVLLGDDLAAIGSISEAEDAYTHAIGMDDSTISSIAQQRLKSLK